MNGGELLVECLARNGVTVIFGVPGGQAAPLYAALEGDARVEYVMMRDERNCAYAADAYARVSGRCAVVDATVGPGVTKLPSGLGEAYNSSIPIVALVTNVPTDEQYLADRGQVLQGLDQLAMLRPVVKQVYRVPRLDALPRVLNRATIAPSLIRFSMSGFTQYLIDSPSAAWRCTSVTEDAPLRYRSSAASTAEFLPPTITTRCR